MFLRNRMNSCFGLRIISFLVILSIAFGNGPDQNGGTKYGGQCYDIGDMTDEFFACINDNNHKCAKKCGTRRQSLCDELEKKIIGFPSEDERGYLCALNCKKFEQVCAIFDPKSNYGNDFGFDYNGISDFVNATFMRFFLEFDPNAPDTDIIPSIEIDTFMIVLKRTFPIMLTIIPLLLNQYEYFNFFGFLIGNILLMWFYFVSGMSTVQFLYNVMMWLLCLVSDAGRNPLKDAVLSYCLMMASIFLSFYVDGWTQYAAGILVLIGYIYYLYVVFIEKRSVRGIGVIVMIGQILIASEQVVILRRNLMMDTFGLVAFESILNAVLPSGSSVFWIKNASRLSHLLIKYVTGHRVMVYFATLLAQALFFIAFRCLFGTYVINSLRFKVDAGSLALGGLLYASDVFGGIHYLWSVTVREQKINARRVTYSVVNLLMGVSEFWYAREFFYVRLFIWASDKVLWSSVYSSAPRYLHLNLDMRNQAYPQVGDAIWVSLSSVGDVAKYVTRLKAQIDGKWYSGLGFIAKYKDSAQLLTVNHVGKCDILAVGDYQTTKPDVDVMTGSEDPIIAVHLEGYDGKACSFVNLLSEDEFDDIKQVFVVSLTDGNEEAMIYATGNFGIDRKGDLRVKCSLKHGDSGGPVFAALADGTLRYAGAVSRTSDKRGKGHKFSFVTTGKHVRFDSDSEASVGRKHVVDFNRQRGNLNALLCAQEQLFNQAEDFRKWIIDVSTEEGYRTVDDDASDYRFEYDDLPEDYEEKKKSYERKRKKFTGKLRDKLKGLASSSRCVFSDEEEAEWFMTSFKGGADMDFRPGSLVSFKDGMVVIDDNPLL